jgi:hypothetical protein
MIRHVAGLLALLAVGLPLLTAPSWPMAGAAGAAGALCAAGIARFSIPLLTAGISLSLAHYTVALWLSSEPPGFVVAVALGVTLTMLFEVVGFAARFRGAAVDARALREQARSWVVTASAAAAVGLLLAMGASAFTLRLSPPASAALAAVGGLGAFWGVVRAVRSGADRVGHDRMEES